MSAAELRELMGPAWRLHRRHQEYLDKREPTLNGPPSVLVPNLAGKQPVLQGYDAGLLGQLKAIIALAFK